MLAAVGERGEALASCVLALVFHKNRDKGQRMVEAKRGTGIEKMSVPCKSMCLPSLPRHPFCWNIKISYCKPSRLRNLAFAVCERESPQDARVYFFQGQPRSLCTFA